MTRSPSSLEQQVQLALRQAVAAELERKRRLGQYSVFWRDGHPVLEGPDAPPSHQAEPIRP